jgi:hypothetical protein
MLRCWTWTASHGGGQQSAAQHPAHVRAQQQCTTLDTWSCLVSGNRAGDAFHACMHTAKERIALFAAAAAAAAAFTSTAQLMLGCNVWPATVLLWLLARVSLQLDTQLVAAPMTCCCWSSLAGLGVSQTQVALHLAPAAAQLSQLATDTT